MLLIPLPFWATDWICCCFICNLMAIMITSPDGMLSPAKVNCVLVNPALHTSHECCILDKMGGAHDWNLESCIVIIGTVRWWHFRGPWVHVVKWIFRSVATSSRWSRDPEAMPQSDPRSLSQASSDPGSCAFDDGGKGFPTAIFYFSELFLEAEAVFIQV